MNKRLNYLILGLVLVFGVLLVYFPHYNYDFPLHIDEWNLIGEMRNVQSFGLERVIQSPIESGFVLSLVFVDSFVDIVKFYKFLPALNFLIIGLVLFYFLNKEYNYWTGLLGVLFFASLKSNVNVLGNWFFVPIVFAAIFIYSCLFNLEKSLEAKRNMYLTIFFLFLIAFIHPSSFLVLTLTGVIYYRINYKKLNGNLGRLKGFLFLLIPIILVIYNLTDFFGNLNFMGFLGNFVWGPLIVQINFVPIMFYGLLSSLFAFIGFYVTYKRKELLGFRIYVLISLISLIAFWFVGKTLFSSYQRYLYHFMLGAVVFSAIGLYEFLKFIFNSMKRYKKELRIFILLFVLLISLVAMFYNYGEVYEQAELYYVIDDNDNDAIVFLKNYDVVEKGTGDRVISYKFPGTAIHPITGIKTTGNLNAYYEMGNRIADDFFLGNCSAKKETFDSWKSYKYVYSYEEINCPFLGEIYRNDKVFLYEEFLD
ncbi:hypothetical protein CMI45_00390 [Candidatus Pacearchaeota archaeon]|jgi:hypothetical protein|nr:hypothetical protein [Candidatus Pacearchaeota archaeon]|tara:strand:+ start:6034 stop:7473 length:1440 start_codon:yes stop_codon:yes gene_type:complete